MSFLIEMKFNLKLLALALLSAIFLQPSLSSGDDSVETIQLSLVVTSADELSLTAIKQVDKGLNAYEAISELVTVGVKDTSFGPQIMSLAGVEAVGNTYWALYVNGLMSMVGAQDVILLEDTFIRLNMEAF